MKNTIKNKLNQMEMKNYGVVETPPRATDFIAGSVSGIPFEERNPSGDWTPYLPEKEGQYRDLGGRGFDTMSCVSFSGLNASVETQLNFFIAQGLLSDEFLNWLHTNGYMQNGKVNCSDRFLAIVSETTTQGNWLYKVADAARLYGFIPEVDLPMGGNSWDEYMNKALITPAMYAKGREFLNWVSVLYEWVQTNPGFRRQALKHAPLQIVLPICPNYGSADGVVPKCDRYQQDHAIMEYKEDDEIVYGFDHYYPFNKKLSKHYYIPAVMKYVVTLKNLSIKNKKNIMIAFKFENTVYVPVFGKWVGIADLDTFDELGGDWSQVRKLTKAQFEALVAPNLAQNTILK